MKRSDWRCCKCRMCHCWTSQGMMNMIEGRNPRWSCICIGKLIQRHHVSHRKCLASTWQRTSRWWSKSNQVHCTTGVHKTTGLRPVGQDSLCCVVAVIAKPACFPGQMHHGGFGGNIGGSTVHHSRWDHHKAGPQAREHSYAAEEEGKSQWVCLSCKSSVKLAHDEAKRLHKEGHISRNLDWAYSTYKSGNAKCHQPP